MGKYTTQVRDLRAGNWFWSQNAILDDYVATGRLSPAEAMTYFALCRLARESEINAGVMRIAKLAGISDRHARTALAKLADLGLIDIERRTVADIGDIPSIYTLVDLTLAPRELSSPPPELSSPPPDIERTTPLTSGHPPLTSCHPFNTRTQDTTKKENVAGVTRTGEEETNERIRALLDRAERIAAGIFLPADSPLTADELGELRRSPVGRAGLRTIGL